MIEAKFKTNVSLAKYTTFRIGGEAKYFLEVSERQELMDAINWCHTHYLPFFILGGGSNVLASDQGFEGLVIHMINKELIVNDKTLTAGAGLQLANLVREANSQGLAGLSWACGIPGSVGGAVRGNAGAYGGEIKDHLHSVEYFDTQQLKFSSLSHSDCHFTYRSSIFKLKPQWIIWQVKFMLSPDDSSALTAKSKEIIMLRLSKLPIYPSAGCVFKNIIISQVSEPSQALLQLINNTQIKGGKLGCGVIIDNLNLKGAQNGGANISAEHANFIVNVDHASSADVQALINQVKDQAKQQFGMDLEEEISYLPPK